MEKSMIQVYTGNGKGKTTAAFGLGLRASGWGKRTRIFQFLKDRESGERKACEKIEDIEVSNHGTSSFIVDGEVKDEAIEEVKKGFKRAIEELKSGRWDILILDELNLVIYYNIIDLEEVLELINKRGETEIIITGRKAPENLLEKADLVTMMKNYKHPYSEGVEARKGIEF